MLTRLRPWQAAAAVIALLLVAQAALLLVPDGSTGAAVEEPAPLSVQPSEIAMAGILVLLVLAVLWLVFSLVARARARRG